MAGITGPISTLPGTKHKVPHGIKCDDCNKPAIHRVQGETDSMGSEMWDYCDDCFNKSKLAPIDNSGFCDWCKRDCEIVRNCRDHEEGLCGPVYRVCDDCVIKYNESMDNYY